MFKINPNARFFFFLDPFHEVKSKREKKKEVRGVSRVNFFFSLLVTDYIFIGLIFLHL